MNGTVSIELIHRAEYDRVHTAEDGKESHSSVDCQCINILMPMGSPNKINYDINALVICRPLDLFCKILSFIIGNMGCAIVNRQKPIQLLLS